MTATPTLQLDLERVRKAVFLTATRDSVPGGIWRVDGGTTVHLVRQTDGRLQCDCTDSQFHPETICKHRIAVQLSRLPAPLLDALRDLIQP